MHNYLYICKNVSICIKTLVLSIVLLLSSNASALVLTPDFEVQLISNVGGVGASVAVNFDNVYFNPVPVCTLVLADINDDPTTVRIDSLSMTGMTIYLQGPAGATIVPSSVHCIVMDEGEYTVAADGFEAEARLVESDDTNGNGDWNLSQTEDVTMAITGNYANPVVIGQVITSNDPAFSTFWSHNCDDRRTPSFEGAGDVCVGKHSSFIANVSPPVANETIGYIVFEEATGVLNGIHFETERGSDTIVGVDPNLNTSYNLDNTYDYNFAVASQSAEDGGNGAWAVLHGTDPLAGGVMNVAVDEANLSASVNARAHTTEQVDYIAFAASELTLEKTVINDNNGPLGDTDFPLTADGPVIDVGSGDGNATSTSQFSVTGVEGDAAITDEIVYPDTYDLSEIEMPGYTAGAWSCTDGTLTGTEIELEPGDDAVCTIINDDDPAELTIIKAVVNDNGGNADVGDFDVQTDAGGLLFDGGTTIDDTITYTADTLTVDAGAYDLLEQNLPGYQEGSWSCDGAGAVVGTFNSGSVELFNGEDVTCSITNDDIGADLEIMKSVSNETPIIGQTVTFMLTVTNNGPDDATNIVIDDLVLAGFSFVGGSMIGGDSQNQAAPNLQWTINSLPAGAANAVTLTYQATVN